MTDPRCDGAGTTRRRWADVFVGAAPVLAVGAATTGWEGSTMFRAAVAAVVAVVVLAAAPRRGPAADPWRLIGFGLACWAAGAVSTALAASNGRPFPSNAELGRAGGLGLVAVAMMLLATRQARRVDWLARIDTAIAAVAACAVGTVLVLPEIRGATGLGSDARLAVAALGALFVAVAAASTRFAVSGGGHEAAGRRLLAGVWLLFLGGAVRALAELDLADRVLDATGSGLVALGLALLASAAIHPTARSLGHVADAPPSSGSGTRLVTLTCVAAMGPLLALAVKRQGTDIDVTVLAANSTLLVALFAARLELMVRAGRRWAQREQTLRDAAGALGAARSIDGIWAALVEAVRRLVGEDLRLLGTVVYNDRGSPTVAELYGRSGPVDAVATGVATAVFDLPVDVDEPFRLEHPATGELVVTPINCRIAHRGALLLGVQGATADDLDESLALLGTQAAFALDAAMQAEELHSKRSEARFQEIVRNSSDAIFILDADGRIRYQTPSVVRVLGFLGMDLDGAKVSRLVHPDHVGHLERFLDGLAETAPQTVRTTDLQLVRADDSIIHAEVVGSNLVDVPDVAGVVLTVRDVTGRRTLEDQLRHQAFHDALTGLPNRALFIDRVDHALNRVRRDDDILPAVVFIDLDDFKTVNDSLGHGAGDELLRIVADRLRQCLRSGDTPARLSGDEFAVLLEDAPDNEAVVEVAERVLDALLEPVTIEENQVYVKASIGVATRKGPATTSDELLRNADLAMYTAKADGKGCIAVFEPAMHDRAVDRLEIKSELERSVKAGEVDVVYQPIVELTTCEIVAFEALARWTHPVRGPVSPVEFVPIAEETGLILPLGRLVLEASCEQLARWRAARPESDWRISVNLSARQLLAPDLVSMVQTAADGAGVPADAITLELTESVLLSDSERVLRRLHDLKELGVQIAIDDFGTGYSSLSYLQRVPFDVLKIDRAFVSALRDEKPESTLVKTIMDLARTLGRTAVAEGVEDPIEADGLRLLGCELAQGHLFGPASPAAMLEAAHPALASTVAGMA